jgi:hypothetical protein
MTASERFAGGTQWEELKIQLQHEIAEMELGIGLPQCDQEAVFCFLAAYEKVQAIMEKLEEK